MTGDKDGSVSDGEDVGFNVALLLEEEVGIIVVGDMGDLVGRRGTRTTGEGLGLKLGDSLV